jgi:nicotinamide phosphoribosyltransferase
MSGLGHLLFFTGTDSLPSIDFAKNYYAAEGLVGGSVPATEHSVMCAGGQGDELETYDRIIGLYPKGIVSIVSDTWDLWKVIEVILPKLKDKIMARDGKVVIRPDSGDPVKILCGDPEEDWLLPAHHGVIDLLWAQFGGTVNEQGYRVLDSHIGAIYGDSITVERAEEICQRLKAKGYASTNVVFGIGSYTYNYTTRDVHSFAIKATWTQRNDIPRMMQKDPVTGSGKKSASGRLWVNRTETGELELIDGFYTKGMDGGELKPVWENGKFLSDLTLYEMRERAEESLAR